MAPSRRTPQAPVSRGFFLSLGTKKDAEQACVPIAHGNADQIVALEVSGQRSQGMIAGSRLEVVKGAPHGFAATHPEQLNRLMLDFLAS